MNLECSEENFGRKKKRLDYDFSTSEKLGSFKYPRKLIGTNFRKQQKIETQASNIPWSQMKMLVDTVQ